jgi:hypothetical protein
MLHRFKLSPLDLARQQALKCQRSRLELLQVALQVRRSCSP